MRGVTHQEPEDIEAVFLGQGSQGFYRFFLFHISMIKEITKYGKRAGFLCMRAME